MLTSVQTFFSQGAKSQKGPRKLISLNPPPTDGISWCHKKVHVYDLSCPTGLGVLTGGVSITMVTRVEYIYTVCIQPWLPW